MSHGLDAALARQPRVRAFLERTLDSGSVSHAYLFVGPPSAHLAGAARALAQALVCPEGGCGTCAECRRVLHGTHPDVLALAPQSAQQGYLVDQVREVIVASSLSPVRAHRKVYVFEQANRLGVQAANALLKTLEEPTDDVVFILLAASADAVLPTIRSRCTVVPFAASDPLDSVAELVAENGCDADLARAILAVSGSVEEAREILASETRLALRERILTVLGRLEATSDWELMKLADEIIAAAKEEGADDGGDPDRDEAVEAEFLSRTAQRELAARRKRLGATRTRAALGEALRVIDVALSDALGELAGSPTPPRDPAHAALAHDLARRGLAAILGALEVTAQAARDLSRPATPALVFQVMLLRLKEALCPTFAQ